MTDFEYQDYCNFFIFFLMSDASSSFHVALLIVVLCFDIPRRFYV